MLLSFKMSVEVSSPRGQEALEAARDAFVRGEAEASAGRFSGALGDLAGAAAQFGVHDAGSEAHFETLRLLGFTQYRLGKQDAALATFEEGAQLANDLGDIATEGRFRNNMGNIYATRRHFSAALAAFRESLRIAREIGDREAEAKTLGNLGSIHYHLGQYAEAIRLQEETLALARSLGLDELVANTLCNLSQALPNSEMDRTVELFAEARTLYERSGRATSALDAAMLEAEALWELGRHEASRALVAETFAKPLLEEIPVARCRGLLLRAQQRLAAGDFGAAFEDLSEAEQVAREGGFDSTLSHILRTRLEGLRQAGRDREALDAYDAYFEHHCKFLETRESEALSRQRAELEVEQTRERLHLQEEQRATLLALNEEVLTQNESLRRLNGQLRELLDERAEFTAILAHDLSNPLFALENGLSLLLPHTAEAGFSLARSLEGVARDATGILRRLLDRSTVEMVVPGDGRFSTDLVTLLEAMVRRYQNRIPPEQAGFATRFQVGSLRVDAPEVAVERIFDNLLSNAVRYGLSDRPVELSLERRDEEAIVRVRDFGPGISEEIRTRLLAEPVPPSPDVTGSTGLGLSLAARLVERMGGELRIESVSPPGACFVCALPLLHGQ